MGWRGKAKVIAILEIVFLSINILWLIINALLVGGVIAVAAADKDHEIVEEGDWAKLKGAVWLIVLVLVIGGISIAIEMFAAVKLLNAAQIGMDPRQALNNARIWRTITIIFVTVSLILNIIYLSIISLVVTIVWRAICFYIVLNFIKELNQVVGSGSSGDPSGPLGVMVQK